MKPPSPRIPKHDERNPEQGNLGSSVENPMIARGTQPEQNNNKPDPDQEEAEKLEPLPSFARALDRLD
jgi:hypothetical protein